VQNKKPVLNNYFTHTSGGEENDDFYDEYGIRTDPGQGPVRIDKFLTDRLERVTRSKVQNAIKAGSVTVFGKVVKSNYKVKPLDEILVIIPRSLEGIGKVIAQDIPLDIIYEDEDVLVVNKPAGMVVHPGISNFDGTLVNALAYYFRERELPVMDGSIVDRPGLVHRIDKNTSGLLVIAKTDYAMTHLAKQFFDHSIERKYIALVWGSPEPPEGTINAHVGKHERLRQRQEVFPDGDKGKVAITHYRTIESMYYVSLVECQLETGRTHQIRVHMEYIGNPLFSDGVYGGDRIRKGTIYTKYRQFVENAFKILPRQALHAQTLGFTHPVSGERLRFELPPPEDFTLAVEKWRAYVTNHKNIEES
jgi:23S rRNA pseudouridine1911/1915/1917 synthase